MTKVTINDVAIDAGVSRATADRVLNRRGGVSMARERAVISSARKLGLDRNLHAAPLKSLRVCVLMKPPQNPFYERLARGFREANLLFAPQAVTAYVSHIDVLAPETIHLQLEKMVTNYDALVIVAPARQSIVGALRDIGERIPVITLATDLPLGVPHHYVGPNNYQAGRLAGELMGRLLEPAGGSILLVAGLQEFRGHEERKNGFKSILHAEFPRCTIVSEIENLDQSTMAADSVVAALLETPSVRGIYNISQGNDEIARRIGECSMSRAFAFICHDLSETTRSLLLSRQIDVVIDQDPLLEARRAVEIVLHHYGRTNGAPIDGSTPIRVFFRENVANEIL